VARKETKEVCDQYEEEYGPSQVIYITERAHKRLNGDENYGKWYQTCQYSTLPTAEFCVRATVPQSSLEDGVFHPDRFEPDIVAERCKKVSLKEITRSVKENQPKPKFKKGDKVAIAVHGAGVVSYEPHIVEKVRRGVVYLADKDGFVFDANTGRRIKAKREEPDVFGFWSELLPESKVPADGWREGLSNLRGDYWKRLCKRFGVDP
jgi:ribosomal protein L21E